MSHSNESSPLLTTDSKMALVNSSNLFNNHTVTGSKSSDPNFFDTFYSMPRFWTETVSAVVAIACNSLVLTAMNFGQGIHRLTIYNILFVNLAVVNCLSCAIHWFGNNLLILFHHRIKHVTMCSISMLLSCPFYISHAFGMVTALTMVGFILIQYFAVCCPLQQLTILRRRKIHLYLGAIWIIPFVVSSIPMTILILMVAGKSCETWMIQTIYSAVIHSTNVSTALNLIIYLSIVLLCISIYRHIRRIRHQVSAHRSNSVEADGKDRRAFVTILILVSTLTLFLLPYFVVHVLSLNLPDERLLHDAGVIYYMNLMPYVKYVTDPIIYGLRMREVNSWCERMKMICCRCESERRRQSTSSTTILSTGAYPRRSYAMVSLTTKQATVAVLEEG